MLRLASEGKPLRVVEDQVSAPTYTGDLAHAIARLLAADAPGGVYHLTNAGECSWFEFARRIFTLCSRAPSSRRRRAPSTRRPRPRPPHSVLRNTRAAALGLPAAPARGPKRWTAYLRAKGHLAPLTRAAPGARRPSATMRRRCAC